MPDITDLPVMTRADAIAAGFAGYNDVPHKPIDVPDGAFTITAKTREGRRVTFCFLESTYGGPPRFIDIQFHDRGTTSPNADNGVSPTFNAFAITRGGKFVADSRPLDEDIKPSILVLMLDKAGEEPTRPSHQNARGDVEEPPQHQRQHDAQRDVQKGRWCGGRRGLCHDDPEALSLSG